jgi:nitrogen fixation protein FixH
MIKTSRAAFLALFAACLTMAAYAGQQKPKSASINLLVVREANGKPVRNAEVVLHQVDPKGKQREEGLELKTHEDGKASVSVVYGKWRIQVIANGFKTYGEDFDINQPNHEITIKMQKPAGQYSIYK